MSWNKKIGDKGETVAVEYLQRLGYIVLETNWRHSHKEIDIIALFENLIIFIEVKTRTSNSFGKPYEAVSEQKQEFLIDAAEYYIEQNDILQETRFDIISIEKTGNTHHIEHIKDAFHAEL